jgi:outer membrane protein TolC
MVSADRNLLRLLLTCFLCSAGCVAAPPGPAAPVEPFPRPAACLAQPSPVVPAGHEQAALAHSAFASQDELSVDALVQDVLAHNPSLTQMVAAWKAAESRYPQVTALDDPMFGVQAAPGAFGSNTVDGGFRLEASQKYPFCGKRALRGQSALAEAEAAGAEVEDMRLQLTESARSAFYDYFLANRALDVNQESLRLLQDFRQKASDRYERVPGANQQDTLQADVEIGRQQERRATLERMRETAAARINTLMHRPPDVPLPPPPRAVRLEGATPDAAVLRREALTRRPDLKALADRVAADQAALELARKEYAPDVEVMAAYDSIWQERPLRAQVGVRVNLPVRLARRAAAVAEAEARLAQRQAEWDRLADQVGFQVQEAVAQVREAERIVRLYETEVLRAAQKNVDAAKSAYETGKIPFVALIEAQRNLVNLRDRYFEAAADYGRRRAALERAVGGP